MVPKISVLVPTYNRADLLPLCLESVFQQSVPPFEVIVIDDGSTDRTPEILREYGDRIRHIPKPNGGKSSALNLGLDAVRGDYIWIIDDDDIALPHALEHLVAPLESNPALGMTFAGCIMADTRPDGSLALPGSEREMPLFPDCDLFLALLQKGCFLGQSAIMARTSVYREAGPFDPRLIRALDWDMALRLSHACAAVRVPGSTFLYRQHAGPRGSAKDRFDAGQRMAKWRAYDMIIAQKLRSNIPIEDYLSRSDPSAEVSPTRLRQAYLQRSEVMARFGRFEEMLEDLRLAFAVDGSTPLSGEERRIWNDVRLDLFLDGELIWDRRFACDLRQSCSSLPGREVPFLLARQLYWSALGCLRMRRYRKAMRYLTTILRLLSLSGLARSIRYKLCCRKEAARGSATEPAETKSAGRKDDAVARALKG